MGLGKQPGDDLAEPALEPEVVFLGQGGRPFPAQGEQAVFVAAPFAAGPNGGPDAFCLGVVGAEHRGIEQELKGLAMVAVPKALGPIFAQDQFLAFDLARLVVQDLHTSRDRLLSAFHPVGDPRNAMVRPSSRVKVRRSFSSMPTRWTCSAADQVANSSRTQRPIMAAAIRNTRTFSAGIRIGTGFRLVQGVHQPRSGLLWPGSAGLAAPASGRRRLPAPIRWPCG